VARAGYDGIVTVDKVTGGKVVRTFHGGQERVDVRKHLTSVTRTADLVAPSAPAVGFQKRRRTINAAPNRTRHRAIR
jgi:hypothetical protein